MSNLILFGDCRETLRFYAENGFRARTCVTSPSYFGLRDYDHKGQIGLEKTPDEYIAKLVEVFRRVRDVLTDDGTLWLNLGDTYANDSKWAGATGGKHAAALHGSTSVGRARKNTGLGNKQLLMIPARVALALQADGWYLRQEIIWAKPNPMPESVTDRCTKSHEKIYLLAKSQRYYFDHEAIKEPVATSTKARLSQDVENQRGSDRVPGKTNGPMKAVRSKANSFKREGSKREQAIPGQAVGTHRPNRVESEYDLDMRNKRDVWTIPVRPYKGAHFATFPPPRVNRTLCISGKHTGRHGT